MAGLARGPDAHSGPGASTEVTGSSLPTDHSVGQAMESSGESMCPESLREASQEEKSRLKRSQTGEQGEKSAVLGAVSGS